MKSYLLAALAGLGLALAASPVRAEKLPRPTAEYSADRTMETEEMTIQGRVYHAADKERQEMNMQGTQSIQILRQDKKVMWMLMPAQRMYMEHALGERNPQEKSANPDDMDFEMTEVGEETVNGVPCTKMKIIATNKDGSKFGGFMWLAKKEKIMVKMDSVAKSESSGKKMRMKIELSNIKFAKQDASLFEIPSGYNKMNMPMGMGAPGAPPGKGAKGKAPGAPPSGMPPGMGPGMTPEQMREMMKKMQQGGGE